MKFFFAGLAAAVMSTATGAFAAGYEPAHCSHANTGAVRAICESYSLGQADARMATLFSVATSLVGMGKRGELIDTQREWLKKRNGCGSETACLMNAYELRIQQLDAIIASIASRGPY